MIWTLKILEKLSVIGFGDQQELEKLGKPSFKEEKIQINSLMMSILKTPITSGGMAIIENNL